MVCPVGLGCSKPRTLGSNITSCESRSRHEWGTLLLSPVFDRISRGRAVMCAVVAWLSSGIFCAAWADVRLLSITNFDSFSRVLANSEGLVLVSPELQPGFRWKELIVSWNAATNVSLSVEGAAVISGSDVSSLGRWTSVPGPENPEKVSMDRRRNPG